MLYNRDTDVIDFVGRNYIECSKPAETAVYSYAKGGFDGSVGRKPRLPFVAVLEEERMVLVSLLFEGRAGVNPNLDAFLADCLENPSAAGNKNHG